MRLSDARVFPHVSAACAWALARAHARAGHPWLISGYVGNGDAFDLDMAKFAVAHADQTEIDHAALEAVVAVGKIDAQIEEDN